MHTQLEHLQLTEKLFRETIRHLHERIQRVQEGGEGSGGPIDFASDERVPPSQSTVTALRLEVCLYSLCVDWVQQQRAELQGLPDEARRHARENFFRLMTSMAQSELTRDAHSRSVHMVGRFGDSRPLTDAQMFTAIEGVAERQLASLIAM